MLHKMHEGVESLRSGGAIWPRQFICILSSAVLLFLTNASADSDWKPIPRPSALSVTYHGNFFRPNTASPAQKRYTGLPLAVERDNSYQSASNRVTSSQTSFVPQIDDGDRCTLFKVGFPNQSRYFQYIQYKVEVPTLKEFTLCLWHKFENHSNDHPLFSYSVDDNPKAILSWVSNTQTASYFSMAVRGHTFYRLNYPLKINRWYHSCQSWNGKTGEWQIWVNGERVGRGFHNRLVGLDIKSGGIAISGQDQAFIGDLLEGKAPNKGSGGMLGEIALVQLYSVALTAGKAHKDHKHHHVHHFTHDGSPSGRLSNNPPPPAAPPALNNAFVVGGQIPSNVQLNLGNPQSVPVQLSNGIQVNQQYINGQFGPTRVLSEQLINAASYGSPRPQTSNLLGSSLGPSRPSTVLLTGGLVNPANVQYIDDIDPSHALFKRDHKHEKSSDKPGQSQRTKRDNPEKELIKEAMTLDLVSKKQNKRGLIELSDGSLIDDSLLENAGLNSNVDIERFQESLLLGLAGFGGNVPVQNIQKESADEREPAEAEVRAVMEICDGCAEEPFQKALVIGWRTTGKKLYSGAAFFRAAPVCGAF